MAEPLRLRVYDARFDSAFTARILDLLKDDARIRAQAEPLDPSLGGRRALIAFTAPSDEDLGHYDWIHVAGAGIDKISRSVRATGQHPIMTRTIGCMGQQMAEYTLSYILADFQRHQERRDMEQQQRWVPGLEAQRYLFETDVAILGTGAIGSNVAATLRPLVRKVIGLSRRGTPKPPFDQALSFANLADLPAPQVIVSALPNTPDTEGLLGKPFFETLGDVLFLNIGRGEPVDEEALRQALDANHVRAAVLDVFKEEPLPPQHWAWTDERVTVTSHLSGITRPEDTVAAFLKHLDEAENGQPHSTVDPYRGY